MAAHLAPKHNYCKLLIISLIVNNLMASSANAQILLPSIASQEQIYRIQNKEIEKKQIETEKENIRKKRLFFPQENITKKVSENKALPCFKINKFEFNKNKIIGQKTLQKLSNEYLDQCFSIEIISKLKNDIYLLLSENGNITSQVIFPQQNISDGIVKIDIVYGKIKKIILNNEKLSDKIQKFLLFGDLSEDILDVNILNQGLFQLNKMPSANAKMKILPSEEDSYSNIQINNASTFPIRANVSHDNLGNEFTGVKRVTFSTSADNLLSMSEVIDLSFTNNLNDSNSKKEMESVTTSIAIPFRHYTLSYNYSDTSYMGKIAGENGDYTVNGFSRRKSFTIDRMLINKNLYSLNLSSSLILKNMGSENLLIDLVNSTQKRLSVLDLSLSFSKSFTDNSNIYLKSTILQGLKSFNAGKDNSDAVSDQAKFQYRAYKVFITLSKPFKIAPMNSYVTVSSEIDSQISQDTLHGSEQFSVGGYYSVRGFRENYISGDSGYYIKNKLNVNLGSLLSSFIANKSSVITSKLYHVTLEPFFDYGSVRDHTSSIGGRLSGSGIKAIFSSKYFDSSITYSKGLSKSQLITGNKKEDQIIYFQLSAKCC